MANFPIADMLLSNEAGIDKFSPMKYAGINLETIPFTTEK